MSEKITWCTECGEGLEPNGNCPSQECAAHFVECRHGQHPEGCAKCYNGMAEDSAHEAATAERKET